ncbi:hypothetical protein C0416_00320 [bacterium]|nr:hypothetical protein [bacterium]
MEHSTKKFPFILFLAFIFVLGVALGFGYYNSQAGAINDQIKNVDQQIAEISNQLEDLKSNDIVSAQNAVSALEVISSSEVEWSEVMGAIVNITPKDLVALRALVEFTSYSGAEGGRLTLNGRTYPSTDVRELLNSVAKTIDAFNENPDFAEAFVPSISKSVSENEETILSFILNVTYKPSYTEGNSAEEGVDVPRK